MSYSAFLGNGSTIVQSKPCARTGRHCCISHFFHVEHERILSPRLLAYLLVQLIAGLQTVLNEREDEPEAIDMYINANKFLCTRFGPAFHVCFHCHPLIFLKAHGPYDETDLKILKYSTVIC